MENKLPFDIDTMMARIGEAVRPYPKAALFDLYDRGYRSAFEILVACIISIRTRDEVSLPVALALFAKARTPAEMAGLSLAELDRLIALAAFHEPKARQIHAMARRIVEQYGGEMPCERDTLLSFAGVGPKCANLTLGIACDQLSIGVDIHVHRVTNRWGYVSEPSPEATMAALEAKLPRHYWVEINRLLVPFGKHVCTGKLPACSTCPVLAYCRQVGVTKHR